MIINRTAKLVAVASITMMAVGPEFAAAGNGKFNLNRNAPDVAKRDVVAVKQRPDLVCRIGGPNEFRDMLVTNTSGRPYRFGMKIYWQAKIGGQVRSGKTDLHQLTRRRGRGIFYPGETVSIPLGTGGNGVCQAKIGI